MNNQIGWILISFGLITVFIGTFYSLFLRDKTRTKFVDLKEFSKLLEDLSKGLSLKNVFDMSTFTYRTYVNLLVWVGIIYIVIILIILLSVFIIMNFTPASFSYPFADNVGKLITWMFGR